MQDMRAARVAQLPPMPEGEPPIPPAGLFGERFVSLGELAVRFADGRYSAAEGEALDRMLDNELDSVFYGIMEDEAGLDNSLLNELLERAKDPNYVSVHRYAPQTPSAIAAQRAEWLPSASKSEAAKGLSEILAAQQIAKERDPQNSGKAIVISAASEKEDRKLLERKASEIRRNQVRNLCAEGGKNLTSSLTRAQQQLMQPSTQMSK